MYSYFVFFFVFFFFFEQKTAYEIVPCDWSSDVCSSDLGAPVLVRGAESRDPQRLLHLVEQLLLIDRLGEEAEGAHLGRLHRVRDGAVSGEDDDLQSRPAVLQLLDEPDAVHL